MTKSEALNTLMKMRAWRRWGKGEQNEKDRPEMPEQKEVDEAFDVCIEMLSKSSLPSNLDEAALKELQVYLPQGNGPDGICYFIAPQMLAMYKAGAELIAGQYQKIDSDLEKEAEAYWKAQGGGSHAQWDKFRAVVKHFTEWQKEHFIEGL